MRRVRNAIPETVGRVLSCAACAAIMLFAAAAPAHGQCDPQELANLIASDAAANDNFGVSVAVSGDTAVVGANLDDHAGGADAGSAYVFVLSGGAWSQQQKLTASDAAAVDNFGYSVAVSGDTAVVGAFNDSYAGMANQGSAYVFVRSGGVWTQQQKLTASDAQWYDYFGWSVAVSGDTAVVGALYDDYGDGYNLGSAYVFVRSDGVWTEQAMLTAPEGEGAGFDEFGISVALSCDTAVVGADFAGLIEEGLAYVFVRNAGVWTQQAELTASDAGSYDNFGIAVAMSGDTAVVGAARDTHAGGYQAGSTYAFVRSSGVWTQQAKLTASDAAEVDRFGISVALSGDTAMVGAYLDNHDGGTDAGSAYIFTKPPSGWTSMTETAKLTASDAAANDQFGIAVAVSGDTAVVGAHFDDNAGGTDAGSAYVFDLGCTPECCTGDFDGDNAVTEADIAGLMAALLGGAQCPDPPACCPGDLNTDGMVDGDDIPGFVTKLFSGGACP